MRLQDYFPESHFRWEVTWSMPAVPRVATVYDLSNAVLASDIGDKELCIDLHPKDWCNLARTVFESQGPCAMDAVSMSDARRGYQATFAGVKFRTCHLQRQGIWRPWIAMGETSYPYDQPTDIMRSKSHAYNWMMKAIDSIDINHPTVEQLIDLRESIRHWRSFPDERIFVHCDCDCKPPWEE